MRLQVFDWLVTLQNCISLDFCPREMMWRRDPMSGYTLKNKLLREHNYTCDWLFSRPANHPNAELHLPTCHVLGQEGLRRRYVIGRSWL